tara:strand:+ start:1019 stop:1435 length:417 start_codon:yes stop_codon:yes gene_type:complete
MKLKEISMLTAYFLIGLGGIIVGGVSTLVITKKKEEPVSQPVQPIIVQASDQVSDVAKQLTNLDLLVEPCSAEYIKENGDLLCREMYCRVMQRGVEAKTSGVECEEISNVANSQIIINHCEAFLDGSEECYEKYRERK